MPSIQLNYIHISSIKQDVNENHILKSTVLYRYNGGVRTEIATRPKTKNFWDKAEKWFGINFLAMWIMGSQNMTHQHIVIGHFKASVLVHSTGFHLADQAGLLQRTQWHGLLRRTKVWLRRTQLLGGLMQYGTL